MKHKNDYHDLSVVSKWIIRKLFSDRDDVILGDFCEIYNDYVGEKGVVRAKLFFWYYVLITLPEFFKMNVIWSIIMYKNYYKIAFRNIKKYKSFSVINLTGLSLGFICSALIFLWVQDELSYDSFNENRDNIYRVIILNPNDPNDVPAFVSPIPLTTTLKTEFPEVENTTRILRTGRILMTYKEKMFYEGNGILADSDFFNIFSFPFIRGNKKIAFDNPQSIVISNDMAGKYFGEEDAIGKDIIVNKTTSYTVTGVIENVPYNSHLQFDFVRPFALYGEWGVNLNNWDDVSYHAYIQLSPGVDIENFQIKMHDCEKRHNPDENHHYILQPLVKTHLHSNFNFDITEHGNIYYVYIFSGVALFVLLIACINFMNLTTARASGRFREVGLRKVVGANKKNLIRQFFGEAMLLPLLAMVVSIVIIVFILPYYNELTGKNIDLSMNKIFQLILSMIFLSLISGTLSAIYPSLFLSSFQPASVIRGITWSSKKGIVLRRLLVSTQLVLSIILIIGTITAYKQLNYIKSKNLGYNKNHIVYFPFRGDMSSNAETFKNRLLSHPDILSVSFTDNLPTSLGSGTNGADWEGKNTETQVQIQFRSVDHDYLRTFGLEMKQGRFFSEEFITDSNAVVLNESALKSFNMKKPIGKRFKSFFSGEARIIGVVKDFHFTSLHSKIAPLILSINSGRYGIVCVKVNYENISNSMDHLKNIWMQYAPEYPFEIKFLDTLVDGMYKTDKQTGTIIKYFTLVGILISCLGLIGLSVYISEVRKKEIGIRKVLGATDASLVTLFIKDFLLIVFISSIIAWPLAYLIVKSWLTKFAYQISIDFGVFLISGIFAVIIVVVTVGVNAIRSALTNPVDTLRHE